MNHGEAAMSPYSSQLISIVVDHQLQVWLSVPVIIISWLLFIPIFGDDYFWLFITTMFPLYHDYWCLVHHQLLFQLLWWQLITIDQSNYWNLTIWLINQSPMITMITNLTHWSLLKFPLSPFECPSKWGYLPIIIFYEPFILNRPTLFGSLILRNPIFTF